MEKLKMKTQKPKRKSKKFFPLNLKHQSPRDYLLSLGLTPKDFKIKESENQITVSILNFSFDINRIKYINPETKSFFVRYDTKLMSLKEPKYVGKAESFMTIIKDSNEGHLDESIGLTFQRQDNGVIKLILKSGDSAVREFFVTGVYTMLMPLVLIYSK
jgi:hypothetical protein